MTVGSITSMAPLIESVFLLPSIYDRYALHRSILEKHMSTLKQDPSRHIVPNLSGHLLSKHADAPSPFIRRAGSVVPLIRKSPPPPSFTSSVASAIGPSIGGSIGQGIGMAVVNNIFGGIGALVSKIHHILFTAPEEKKIFQMIVHSDPVIQDAIAHNPNAERSVLEAYGTLTRFAPSLATDINAVRTFLREAAISGSGVNYATIKQLVDTERGMHSPMGGGKS